MKTKRTRRVSNSNCEDLRRFKRKDRREEKSRMEGGGHFFRRGRATKIRGLKAYRFRDKVVAPGYSEQNFRNARE